MSSDNSNENVNLPFNYVPSFAAGVTFVVLFSSVTIVHFVQALRARAWWLFPTVVIAGVGEIFGWSGRLWGSKSPYSKDPFLMQISTTILSPTFVLAANFVIMWRLIQILGTKYSRLSPRLYTIVFCTCDAIALIVQAVGGGIASAAETQADADKGGHIALGGIAFQFAGIVTYIFLSVEFLIRFTLKKPFFRREDTLNGERVTVLDSKLKQMILGTGLSTLAMFIRGVYRTIELSDGWSGRIISIERYFIALDGSMILFSMVVLNIFHPSRLLGKGATIIEGEKGSSMVEEEKNSSVTDV